jgi:hypothetical protein
LATVAVPEALAVAVRATATPNVAPAPAVGAVSATTGAAVTVTLIVADVTVVPFESVTRAVSAVTPEAVGVHVVEWGAVSEDPTTVEPTRKSTRVTVTPAAAVAVAVSVGDVPRATEAPFTWLVRTIVGTEVATVTLTADEVVAAVLLSVTRAVSDTAPLAVGVQLTV